MLPPALFSAIAYCSGRYGFAASAADGTSAAAATMASATTPPLSDLLSMRRMAFSFVRRGRAFTRGGAGRSWSTCSPRAWTFLGGGLRARSGDCGDREPDRHLRDAEP